MDASQVNIDVISNRAYSVCGSVPHAVVFNSSLPSHA
jgi:hypothetical protein